MFVLLMHFAFMLLDGQTINNFVDTLPLGRIIKRKMNPSSGTLQYPAMDGVVILSNRGGRCKSHLIPHFLSSASLIGFSHLFILPSWPWFYFIACKWTCQLYYTYHGLAGMSCVTLAWGARHLLSSSPTPGTSGAEAPHEVLSLSGEVSNLPQPFQHLSAWC